MVFSVAEILIADELVACNWRVYPSYKSVIVLLDLVILIPSIEKDASAAATLWVSVLSEVLYSNAFDNVEDELSLAVTLIAFLTPWFAFKTNT